MRLFSTGILVALSLAGSLAGTALAGGAGGPDGQAGPGGRHGLALRGMHRALAGLNLTPEQKENIHAIFQSRREAFHAQSEQRRADHEALRALLESSQPDAATVGAAMIRMHADRAALRAQRDAALASVRAVLTPEQAGRLDGYLAARKDRMEQFRAWRQQRLAN